MPEGMPGTRAVDPASRWLCLCGVLMPWVTVAFVAAASLANPGYSHVSETVSLLGTHERPHPEVIRVGFVVLGLLALCFTWGLYRVLKRGPGARAVLLLLTTCGACVLLSGLFRDDPIGPGKPETLEGTLHSAVAFGALWTLVLAMLVVAAVVHRDAAWSGFGWLAVATVALVLLVSVGFLIEALHPFEGLLQRFLYVVLLIWVEAVSLRSFRLAAGQGGRALAAVQADEAGGRKALSA